jgi:hypothetical protein
VIGPTMLLLAFACASKMDDTGDPGELPPEEEVPPSTSDTGFEVDTGLTQGEQDDVPDHTLTLDQQGYWELTPLGGPYTALTGKLDVLEILDGAEEEPACELEWSMTGALAEEGGCEGCGFTFDVEFYLSGGEPEPCYDPELPEAGEVWRLGFHEGDGVLLRDYGGTGVWIPWFEAALNEDTLSFSWTAEVGVSVDEDER